MQIRLIIAVAAYGVLATAILLPPPVLAGSGTEAFDRDMQPVLASYLKIQEQLAADSLDGVGTGATALAQAAAELDAGSVTGEHGAHYKDVPANLRRSAQALSKARDITTARDQQVPDSTNRSDGSFEENGRSPLRSQDQR